MNILGEGARPYPPTSVSNLTGASASSAAIAISPGYYVFECLPTTDANNTGVRVLFGTSSVADATTSNGWLIAPGTRVPWYVPASVTHYKHIRNGSADAPFQMAKSGD